MSLLLGGQLWRCTVWCAAEDGTASACTCEVLRGPPVQVGVYSPPGRTGWQPERLQQREMPRGSRAALKSLLIFDQNVRGLRRDEKKEELYVNMRQRGAFAATLQETWLTGNETLEGGGFTTVCSSVDADQQCNRGEQGVAIVLSAPAAQAWRESGGTVVRVSGRVIGLRLEARDTRNRIVGLALACPCTVFLGRCSPPGATPSAPSGLHR